MDTVIPNAIYALIDLVNQIAAFALNLLAGYGISLFPLLGLIAFVALVVQYAL
ncbi:MAG TPA: hypothetical protein VE155_07190 [Pseudonocardiaceae bacterium]|nr:hypothetical protein [Pseudonocardiaceae bacterium]